MSFGDRTQREEQFKARLLPALASLGFTVAPNGTEYTHADFMDGLRSSDDPSALALRFQPDIVAFVPQRAHVFYVEAKSGDTIERRAYEQYTRLSQQGHVVVVVFEVLKWRWNFIEEVKLRAASTTVSHFRVEHRFPVVDGWIAPRADPGWARIRVSNPQASGTPYREVLPSGLRQWCDFKDNILARTQQYPPLPVLEQLTLL